MSDVRALFARAKTDPGMVRDFAAGGTVVTDADLATLLGYAGPGGRNTIRRQAETGAAPRAVLLALEALLDGWRPRA